MPCKKRCAQPQKKRRQGLNHEYSARFSKSAFEGENSAILFSSNSIDEFQYFSTLRRREFAEPEKILLRAVLEDALRCLRKYRFAKNRRGQKLFHEAEEWLLSGADEWIFSFNNVCEALGLNPTYVRRCALRGSEKPLEIGSRKSKFLARIQPGGFQTASVGSHFQQGPDSSIVTIPGVCRRRLASISFH